MNGAYGSHRPEENAIDSIVSGMAFNKKIQEQSKQKSKSEQLVKDYNIKEENTMSHEHVTNTSQETEQHQKYEIGKVYRISIGEIFPPKDPIRKYIAEEHLEDLAEDMHEMGQMQNIGVKPDGELVFGLRRYLAAQKAGLTALECIICKPEDTHSTAMRENLLRKKLTAVELAEAVAKLQKEEGVSQGRLGEILDKDRTDVNVLLQIAKLPQHMRDTFREVPSVCQDKLKKLARLHETPEKQEAYFQQLLTKLNTPKPKGTKKGTGGSGDTPEVSSGKNKVIFATEKAQAIRSYLTKLLPGEGKSYQSRDKKFIVANGQALRAELKALSDKIADVLFHYDTILPPAPQEQSCVAPAQPQAGESEPCVCEPQESALDGADATSEDANDELASGQVHQPGEPDTPADAASPVLSGSAPQAGAAPMLMLPAGATPVLDSDDDPAADDEAATTPQADDDHAEADYAA